VEKDYYPVLRRAVSAVDPNRRELRHAIYDRARQAMAGAPLSLSEITREQIALEAAIRRVEVEFDRTSRVTPPFRSADPSPDETPYAAPHTATGATGSGRMLSLLLVAGVGVAAMLAVGFFGYEYWRKASVDGGKKLAQPPAHQVERPNRVQTPEGKVASYILKRQVVYYRSIHPAGTIVIAKSQNFLHLVRPNTAAMRYTIGVGRECLDVVGLLLVSAKEDWTAADPPKLPQDAQSAVGRFGARSLALGDTGHRIHGSHEPVASRAIGCFPLVDDDVVDLFERVALGARVVVN
jgi:lipoprotein-anchoring transpeptidase ErfK/SrfK